MGVRVCLVCLLLMLAKAHTDEGVVVGCVWAKVRAQDLLTKNCAHLNINLMLIDNVALV